MLLLNLSIFLFRNPYAGRVFSTIYKQSSESSVFYRAMGKRYFMIADFAKQPRLDELPESFYI